MFFCLLCHGLVRAGQDFCPACVRDLPWNQHHCDRCAEPWPDPFQGLCQHCVREEPHYDQCRAPLLYQFPVNQLILGGKQGSRPELFFALARLSAHILQQQLPAKPDVLIPVPLHPHKQQQRGYNQAALVANILGRKLGIPVRHDLVIKVRESGQQKALARAARQQHLTRVFRVQRQALHQLQPHANSQGKPAPIHHVALVDDVITTGSTLNQIARQLRSSGIERVDGLAIARTARKQDNR